VKEQQTKAYIDNDVSQTETMTAGPKINIYKHINKRYKVSNNSNLFSQAY